MHVKTIGVEEWLNIYETSARYDLAQSTIASLTTEEILNLADDAGQSFMEALAQSKQNYGHIEGSDEFKAAVAGLYKNISASQVLQTNGATGANLLALMNLLEPGDHVIAEYPTYQPLYEIPRMLGAEVSLWHMQQEENWQPSLDELESLIRPNTKLICINNASNPLGTVLERDALKRIAAIAQRVGAFVLSDEVYLPLDNTVDFVSMADVYDKAIVTNSLSKTYSVPGIRIGWVIVPMNLIDNLKVWRDYTLISGGVFNDAMAVHVLTYRNKILARNKEIIDKNKRIVQEWIDVQPRVSWIAPKGVSTAFISLDIPCNDEEFCLKLLENYGVLLVPGSRFELPCGARLGYCTNEETLREGLRRISEALRVFDAN